MPLSWRRTLKNRANATVAPPYRAKRLDCIEARRIETDFAP